MKVTLTEALHARPANLLVRLAAQHTSTIEIRKGTCKANARKILDVLSLGAAKGEEIEVHAIGDDANEAARAIVELVERGFSSDLVPETGSAAAEGIAVGRAVVVMREEEASSESTSKDVRADAETERARGAIARAEEELAQLVRALSESEAALFEPERAIVRDAEARIVEEIAKGMSAEDAVRAALGATTTDLIADARARLLDALAGTDGAALAKVRGAQGEELILVTDELTPSLVASLPWRVRGIVAAHEEVGGVHTSHAAILARGRGVPLALVPPHVAFSIADGDEVAIDTTETSARVWVAPSAELVRSSRTRQAAIVEAREYGDHAAGEIASRLGIELCVNVGSLDERVPRSAHGVGLLRTELLFAARTGAPSEDEQHAAIVAVARGAHGKMVTARLFDAGGDKPLAWLPARGDDERGLALLFANAHVLAAQVRAIARAATAAAVRALLPMCRSADDVRAVRAMAPSLKIGAMVETPEAVRDAASIAREADFVCIGTNDLAALVLGGGRAEATRALDPRVLGLVAEVVHAAHMQRRRVTICGEIAADPRGAPILIGLGVDALSVAPSRFSDVARALSQTTRDACRLAAEAALAGTWETR